MQERTCRVCRSVFTPRLGAETRGFHCSMACYRASRRNRVPCACEVCGAITQQKPSTVARGGGKFCGPVCYRASKLAVPFTDRIWPRVNKDGPIPEQRPEYGPCWLWTGAANSVGYGHIGRGDKTPLVSHIVWGFATGREPARGEILGHVCDTPLCVRNDTVGEYVVRGVAYARRGHLFLCTDAANTEDAREKQRRIGKLADGQVREIRARRAAGERQVDLSREYGVTQPMISRIIRGLSHRHSL